MIWRKWDGEGDDGHQKAITVAEKLAHLLHFYNQKYSWDDPKYFFSFVALFVDQYALVGS